MGADACLFVFDYARYRAEVVPGFARFLRDGVAAEWMLEVQRREREALGWEEYLGAVGGVAGTVDLAGECLFLEPDWAAAARGCGWESCAARGRCPFFRLEGAGVEDLLWWFQRCVAERCLGAGQFLGRSVDCSLYWETLGELGAPGRVRELLELLGGRGRLVGYRWTVGTEGIHGWLGPEETRELGEGLFALDLPDYDCSFAGMQGFRVSRDWAGLVWPAYEHPGCSFERLSLSYVRTVCQLAAREGKGVLWGNGVG